MSKSDQMMLAVWEVWARNAGNDGAAHLFQRCAENLRRLREYEAALLAIYSEAQRQVMRGERVTYATASEPIGVRGGEITTRVGDLCDFRNAIQNLLPYDLRERAIEAERRAAAPTPERETPA